VNGVSAPEAKEGAPEGNSPSADLDSSEATTGEPTVAPRSASGLPMRKPRASRITEYREFDDAPVEASDAASTEGSAAGRDAGAPQPGPSAKSSRLTSWLPGRSKAAAEAARLEAEANEPRQMPSNLSAWLDHRAKLVEAAKKRELGLENVEADDADADADASNEPAVHDTAEVAAAIEALETTAASSEEMHVPAEWVAEVAGVQPGEPVVEAAPEPSVPSAGDTTTPDNPEALVRDDAPDGAPDGASDGASAPDDDASLPTRIPGTSGAPTSNEQSAPTGRVLRRAHTTSFFGARKARETVEQVEEVEQTEPAELQLVEAEALVEASPESEPVPAPESEAVPAPESEAVPAPESEAVPATEVEAVMQAEPESDVVALVEPDEALDLEEPVARTAVEEPESAVEQPVTEPVEERVEEAPPAVLNDTPIFRAMMSRWLTDDPGPAAQAAEWSLTDVDEVFSAATSSEEAAPLEQSSAGLPMRRPGNHMVPAAMERTNGAASGPQATNRRDPEAIRRNLNRHQQGVSSARTETQDGTQREEADVHQ
jgi:hypothetical protein